jgi:hypothetical protein
MIEVKFPAVYIRESYLAGILHERASIRAMAVQLVAGQVEGHLDMIADAGPEEYGTYKEIAACIAGAKESVEDYVEDLLAEFRDSLLDEIAKVKIDTKAVTLREDEIDADVSVTIGE